MKNWNIGKILFERLRAAGFRLPKAGNEEYAEKPFLYLRPDSKFQIATLDENTQMAFDVELHAVNEADLDRMVSVLNNDEVVSGAPFIMYLHGLLRSGNPAESEQGVYAFEVIYKFRIYSPNGEKLSEEKPIKEE